MHRRYRLVLHRHRRYNLLIELQSVAQDWAVEAMPTFVFVKEGTILGKVVGAKKEELQQTIERHVASSNA